MIVKSFADLMATAAADAVALTDTFFLESLDFSEASIDVLERLVDDVHYSMPGGKTAGTVDLLARAWGAYLGEVLRRNVGGEWVAWEDQSGRCIAFRSGGITIFPRDKVRQRLVEGSEHNIRDYYQSFRALTASTK